jgi:hypothetical protein
VRNKRLAILNLIKELKAKQSGGRVTPLGNLPALEPQGSGML